MANRTRWHDNKTDCRDEDTSMDSVPILVLLEVAKNAAMYPGFGNHKRKTPVGLVIAPTKGLSANIALGIPVLPCTREALPDARKAGRNIAVEIASCRWSIAHLIDEWDEFRPSFRHIGNFVRGRLPPHVSLPALTATLMPGAATRTYPAWVAKTVPQRAVILVQAAALKSALKYLARSESDSQKPVRNSKSLTTMNNEKALMVTTTSCLIVFFNKMFGNDTASSLLDCIVRGRRLPCSNCLPRFTGAIEYPPSPLPSGTRRLYPFSEAKPKASVTQPYRPKNTKLTRKMRTAADTALLTKIPFWEHHERHGEKLWLLIRDLQVQFAADTKRSRNP
ncbi:hypothetical protein GGX14DRAFT_633048 [Mycena pura]|uniref:Uncharacterized protein n=1 Tax=Mycena pura TaxID=153505 RepID=A0AAD6YAU5_9AGAR|nr:hypothetical protein GGX14DRAFT_633048 [Mycena pura]